MRLLIMGGRNYIGSIVTEDLVQADHEVIVFADFADPQPAAVPPAITLVQGNLADLRTILTRHRGIQAVLHIPPPAGAAASWRHPAAYLRDTVTHGLHLIATAVQHDIRGRPATTSQLYRVWPSASARMSRSWARPASRPTAQASGTTSM